MRGFSSALGGGTSIVIYAPNIRLCEDTLKQCYMSINSAYTSDLGDPYILNTIYVKVVTSVNNPSPVTKVLNTIMAVAPTYGANVDNREICLFTSWNFGSTFYTTPFKIGDAIILIFPSYRYTYRLSAV